MSEIVAVRVQLAPEKRSTLSRVMQSAVGRQKWGHGQPIKALQSREPKGESFVQRTEKLSRI
eukprot:6193453-Pleurochrysis_carterae.AAC.4